MDDYLSDPASLLSAGVGGPAGPANTASVSAGQHDPLVQPIRQLLSNVASNHPGTIRRPLEEELSQLETSDENFHSYELVRLLQRRVHGSVGRLIDTKLEEKVLEGDGHSVVAQITEDVLNSAEYTQLYQSVTADLRTAVDEMLVNDSALWGEGVVPSDFDPLFHSSSSSSSTHYYNLDDSTTSDLSAIHQTGLMFMSPDQLEAIATAIQPTQPIHVRHEGMRHLLQFPSGDLITCENWETLHQAIRHALMDSDTQLSNLSLKLYYRMFGAHTANVTKTVYLSLVEILSQLFQGGVVTLSMGVDPADDRCIQLLAKIRLLNYFQRELPSFWLRYNEHVVIEMVMATFSLLSLSYSHPALLGPLHFIALLDPTAEWLKKWMHGQYSRSFVLEALEKYPIILEGVVAHVLRFEVQGGLFRSRSRRHCEALKLAAGTEAGFYNEGLLEYLHFVFCLCLLERLLLTRKGRELFPVKTKAGSTVTVESLLVKLLQMLFDLSSLVPSTPQVGGASDRTFDPVRMISHLFQEMASGSDSCRQALCKDKLTALMLSPLKSDSMKSAPISEEVVLLMADILAVLASSENGRQHLLFGEKNDHSDESTVANTVARFIVKSLPLVPSATPPPHVLGAWLFICRQLYNTGEGLLVLEPFQLHLHIARAHKILLEAKEGLATAYGRGQQPLEVLEECLVDNLLNFAGTPKGLLLLWQSGLMTLCTQYMHQRYKLKMQVSKYEKFGYGCMVTQLASTVAGIAELNHCGFVKMLVEELWQLLDGGEGDYRLTAPRTHPLDPMDRTSHKAVINLLNILSSFHALYEVLHKATPPDTPSQSVSTIFDLLDRLVLVNSELKRNALINFQEAHLFGLRILSSLVTCLDSFLFLESEYQFVDALLSLQADCNMADSSDVEIDLFIIDACSMERNRLLVSSYFTGGPSERCLPPHYFTEVGEDYPWPLFSSFPAPLIYQISRPLPSTTQTTDSHQELYQFLSRPLPKLPTASSKKEREEWLHTLRQLYCSQLNANSQLSTKLIRLLLQKCVHVLSGCDDVATFARKSPSSQHTSEVKGQVSPMTKLGIGLTVRYGEYLGLLESSPSSTLHPPSAIGLERALARTRQLLLHQQHSRKKTSLKSLSGDYPGYDWFISSLFLVCGGSLEETIQLATEFSTLLHSGYMWLARLHLSVHLSAEVAYSGIHPITPVTNHHLESILQAEVPLVFSAFKMSGYTPSQICQHWVRQCFWNFLNWNEICLYLATCVAMGPDYQVYFCVAILKHLEPKIIRHTQEQNLLVFLKEEGIAGFSCAGWLPFMQNLESKYRKGVLKSMKQLS